MSHAAFLEKTEQLIDRLVQSSRGAKPAQLLTTTIAAGGTYNYDIKTELSNPAGWNLLSTKIEVAVLDNTAGSPTQGFYINAEAVLSYGVNTNGIIRVHNHSNQPHTVLLKLYRPCVKA